MFLPSLHNTTSFLGLVEIGLIQVASLAIAPPPRVVGIWGEPGREKTGAWERGDRSLGKRRQEPGREDTEAWKRGDRSLGER